MSEEKVFPTIADLRKANELLNKSGPKERTIIQWFNDYLITFKIDEINGFTILDIKKDEVKNDNGDKDYIHQWFGLSYANYLTLPRSILQSMPEEWQKRFVECLYELDSVCINSGIETPNYTVSARKGGRFVKDKYRFYWKNGVRSMGLINVFNEEKQ